MPRSIDIDPQVLHKHSPVAQYARFYPLPQLLADFDEKDYTEHARHSNTVLLPKKLSIYVHAPEWLGSFRLDRSAVDEYWESLRREVALQAQLFSDDRVVSQIIFCGTILDHFSIRQIAELLDELASQFHLDLPPNLTISMELAAGPQSAAQIRELRNIGFTRFLFSTHASLETQAAAERRTQDRQNLDCHAVACAEVATLGGCSATVEIRICENITRGANYYETLKQLAKAGVPLINAHNFAVPYRTHRKQYHRPSVSGSAAAAERNAARAEIVNAARLQLLNAGYRHIGADHYALPNQATAKARNNDSLQVNLLGYSADRETDWVGIGLGAISKFDTCMARNTSVPKQYLGALQDRLLPISEGRSMSDQEKLCVSLMKQIMCRREVDLTQSIGRYTGTSSQQTLGDYFAAKLEALHDLRQDGLLVSTENGFRITKTGRYFTSQIAARFCNATHRDDGKVVHFSPSH